jgi:cation:H+ antiporter
VEAVNSGWLPSFLWKVRMTLAIVLLLVGLALLAAGGEVLVRGAAGLAERAGISPLIVGLTVVAFSTSAPELAVTLQAVYLGQPDLAVGNVVGSNIANVLLILGVSALIAPLVVAHQLIRVDIPLMIAACGALMVVALDGNIDRLDGAVLLAGLIAYVILTVRLAQRSRAPDEFDYPLDAIEGVAPRHKPRLGVMLAQVVIGIGLLVLGGNALVEGASTIARGLGVSELVIGLTVVAVGTSLPELATSVVAVMRNEREIAIGNVVGSNLFNCLCVMGLTALTGPQAVRVSPEALAFDLPFMLAVAVVMLPLAFDSFRLSRRKGLLLVGYFGLYVLYVLVRAIQPESLAALHTAMLWFVAPLTGIVLIWLSLRGWRRQRTAING